MIGYDPTASDIMEKTVIGVGNREKPTPGATGTLFIDDIGFGRPAAAVPLLHLLTSPK